MTIRNVACISLLLLTANGFAAELKLNIGDMKPTQENLTEYKKYKTTKKIEPTPEVLKSDFVKSQLFSKAYLKKHLTKEDKNYLELEINEQLTQKYIDKLIEKLEVKIDDDVMKSFYIAHKSSYLIPETMDVYQITFTNKEEAEKFCKSEYSEDLIKNHSKNLLIVPKIDIKQLPPLYKLYFDRMKERQFSEAIPTNEENRSLVIFYLNRAPSRTYSYEEAKPYINKYLISKKKDEIVAAEIERLKKESK